MSSQNPTSDPNGLPSRPTPTSLGSSESHSGTGTPIGFQRYPHNKILDNAAGSGMRQPSPQPTHLGIPGGLHRVLSEEDPGYVAAKFEGKQKQMEQGVLTVSIVLSHRKEQVY